MEADDLPFAFHRLDYGGGAFDPVAAVKVGDVLDLFVFGVVDVAADDPFEVAALRFDAEHFFKVVDKHYRFFDVLLGEARERPVAFVADDAAAGVDGAVELEQEVVADIAEFGEPLFGHGDGVEKVAVCDEVAAAV